MKMMLSRELVNPEIVKIQRVITEVGAKQLHELIQTHAERTGSPKAKKILAKLARIFTEVLAVSSTF